MNNNSPSMLKATLIGGALFGFVGGLPFIGGLNCACCALVIGGGFVAAFLYSKECAGQGMAFGAGPGALVGLVAGMFYALATTVTSGVVQLVMGQSMEEVLEQIESMGQEIPPEAEPIIEFLASAGPLVLLVMGFFFWLLVAAVFSTIGGLIGGAVFKVTPAPPAASSPPPIEPGGGDVGGGTPPPMP